MSRQPGVAVQTWGRRSMRERFCAENLILGEIHEFSESNAIDPQRGKHAIGAKHAKISNFSLLHFVDDDDQRR